MTNERTNQNCIEYRSHQPEQIGVGADVDNHSRGENNDLYHALLADLEAIVQAARRLFPAVDPPDEVWKRIELAVKDRRGDKS